VKFVVLVNPRQSFTHGHVPQSPALFGSPRVHRGRARRFDALGAEFRVVGVTQDARSCEVV
jgi:hypothetical protein